MVGGKILIYLNDSNKKEIAYLKQISELKKAGIDPEDPNLDPITRTLVGQISFKYSEWIEKGRLSKPSQVGYSNQKVFPEGLKFNEYGLKVIQDRGLASPNDLQALGMRVSSDNRGIVYNRGSRVVRPSVTFILYQYKERHVVPAVNVVNH